MYLKFASFFSSNDFHNSSNRNLKDKLLWAEGTWDVPIQILAIIKFLNFEKNTFFKALKINKKPHSFPSDRAIFETLKTFGTKESHGISIMHVFLIFWACFRDLFGNNHAYHQLFIDAILSIENLNEDNVFESDTLLTKDGSIIPFQNKHTQTKTMELLDDFIKVLLPKKSNKDIPTIEKIEFLQHPIKLRFIFNIKASPKLYKNIAKNQKVVFNQSFNDLDEAKLKGDFSTALVKFLKYYHQIDLPNDFTPNENIPIIGSIYNFSLYPYNEGEKLEMIFG